MLVVATTPPVTPSADPSASASTTPTPTGVPEANVDETVKAATKTTNDLVTIAWQAGVGAVIGLVIAFVVVAILIFTGRRRSLYHEIVDFGRRPIVTVDAMAGASLGTQLALIGLRHIKNDPTMMVVVERGVTITLIVSVARLVVAFVKAIEPTVVKGVQAGGDQGCANRVTIQSQVLRRAAQVIIVITGLASVIMTFLSVQFTMGSLLVSAGLASVVTGMAARSMLGNVFAGFQLATTDAIRVGDIVAVDDQQGIIEGITLTYVVARTWGDRYLILPSTHFTENPFANWTRGGSQVIGFLTLGPDRRVPITSLRAELARLVAAFPAWDGRQAFLEVFDAVGGHVTVRIVLTGDNPSNVDAPRSYVREELATWLQREAPYALPRMRVEVEQVEAIHDLDPEEATRATAEIVAKQEVGLSGVTMAVPNNGGGGAATTETEGESVAHGLGAWWAVTLGRAMGCSLLYRARRGDLRPR